MKDRINVTVTTSDGLIDLVMDYPDRSKVHVTMRPRDARALADVLRQNAMVAALKAQLAR